MTQLLEKRLTEVLDTVANGIVTQADAQFLVQVIKAQTQVIEQLRAEPNPPKTGITRCLLKKRFPSEYQAQAFAEHGSKQLEPYQCNWCHDWHLTSVKGNK
jgi:hypothetical protein